jgi:hypothetical protein
MFIKNIPIYDNACKELYKSNFLVTNINHENIERKINKLLDRYDDICKYYINIDESYWGVSFNVGIDQLDAMVKTMFELRIFKTEEGTININVSKEIEEHQQWSDVNNSIKNLQFL